MNADGTVLPPLTPLNDTEGDPAFTADGSQIVFTSRRDGNDEIYIMDVDGLNQTPLTNNTAADSEPATIMPKPFGLLTAFCDSGVVVDP